MLEKGSGQPPRGPPPRNPKTPLVFWVDKFNTIGFDSPEALKAAKFKPLVGLARSKQDPVTVGMVLSIYTRPRQPGPKNDFSKTYSSK